jgi:hypothetical protein
MHPDFDPDKLRLPPSFTVAAAPGKQLPRHRPREKFLKGPIPWTWLEKAFLLPGKALHVALLLWQTGGYTNNRTVRLCLNGALPEGLNRQSARRGLKQLTLAGLVSVLRRHGRGLVVTLLDAPESPKERSC